MDLGIGPNDVSRKDSILLPERRRWSAGSLHWQAGGTHCFDSPRELVRAAGNFAIWVGFLFVEEHLAFRSGSVLRTDAAQDRSQATAISAQHDRRCLGHGSSADVPPQISCVACGMAGG